MLSYWSVFKCHVGMGCYFPWHYGAGRLLTHDMKLSQWNILAIFMKRRKKKRYKPDNPSQFKWHYKSSPGTATIFDAADALQIQPLDFFFF